MYVFLYVSLQFYICIYGFFCIYILYVYTCRKIHIYINKSDDLHTEIHIYRYIHRCITYTLQNRNIVLCTFVNTFIIIRVNVLLVYRVWKRMWSLIRSSFSFHDLGKICVYYKNWKYYYTEIYCAEYYYEKETQ